MSHAKTRQFSSVSSTHTDRKHYFFIWMCVSIKKIDLLNDAQLHLSVWVHVRAEKKMKMISFRASMIIGNVPKFLAGGELGVPLVLTALVCIWVCVTCSNWDTATGSAEGASMENAMSLYENYILWWATCQLCCYTYEYSACHSALKGFWSFIWVHVDSMASFSHHTCTMHKTEIRLFCPSSKCLRFSLISLLATSSLVI